MKVLEWETGLQFYMDSQNIESVLLDGDHGYDYFIFKNVFQNMAKCGDGSLCFA